VAVLADGSMLVTDETNSLMYMVTYEGLTAPNALAPPAPAPAPTPASPAVAPLDATGRGSGRYLVLQLASAVLVFAGFAAVGG
jgi:hypothetical protein